MQYLTRFFYEEEITNKGYVVIDSETNEIDKLKDLSEEKVETKLDLESIFEVTNVEKRYKNFTTVFCMS